MIFEKFLSSRNDVVNSFLLVEISLIARTRNRSQDAKNIHKRQAVFETSTNREFSKFAHVKAKTTIFHDKIISSKIQNILHRADSALKRERRRERKRERERESIVVVEQRENLITLDEERERDKKRERSRE